MAFDGTYLTPTLSQIQTHERHGLVGGRWTSENKENAFVSLEEDGVDVSGVPRANTMMSSCAGTPQPERRSHFQCVPSQWNRTLEARIELSGGSWNLLDKFSVPVKKWCVALCLAPMGVMCLCGTSFMAFSKMFQMNLSRAFRFSGISNTLLYRRTACLAFQSPYAFTRAKPSTRCAGLAP